MINKDILNAIEYAKEKHKGQYRKGPKATPYILHPLNVSEILKSVNQKDEVVIAGILHDVVEDTPTKIEEIKAIFGKKVSDLVASVTEKGEGITWDQRLKKYLEKIDHSTPETKMICAADKIDNMRSMVECIDSGFNIFKHMHAGKEKQINKFKLILSQIGNDLPEQMKTMYEQALQSLIQATKNIR